MSAGRERRPAPRRRGPRKVTVALAAVLAVVAFAAGVLGGMALAGRGGDDRLTTVTRSVPVVTVTPGR